MGTEFSGLAISLVARNKSAASILDIWQKNYDFSIRSLEAVPHFTFAIFENFTPGQLKQRLKPVFKNVKPIPATFRHIGQVTGAPEQVWAKPENAEQLNILHHAVHARFDSAACNPSYLPGRWAPYCSLVSRNYAEYCGDAEDCICQDVAQIEVLFNAVEIFDRSSGEVTYQMRLDLGSA